MLGKISMILYFCGAENDIVEQVGDHYVITFEFNDVYFNWNCDMIKAIKYHLKQIGLEVCYHNFSVTGENATECSVSHILEVF